LNVWEEKLPDFDQEAIGAKYKGVNKERWTSRDRVWNKNPELAVRFQQADRIVLGVPMWNFAYPYKLKQLIDLACHGTCSLPMTARSTALCWKTPRAFVSMRGADLRGRLAERPLPGSTIRKDTSSSG